MNAMQKNNLNLSMFTYLPISFNFIFNYLALFLFLVEVGERIFQIFIRVICPLAGPLSNSYDLILPWFQLSAIVWSSSTMLVMVSALAVL
jgi:hypothetical protein